MEVENLKIKQVYVIPSLHCNLKCPHCDIRLKSDDYNEEKFLDVLNSIKSPMISLFGGEPLLYKDRFKKVIKTEKIHTISTNLLLLDEDIIEELKTRNILLATSWNPARFSSEQYNQWIEKLKLLEKHKLKTIIMITLTEDLLTYEKEDFFSKMDEWNEIDSVTEVLFEFLVDPSAKPDLNSRADEWMCNLYKEWKWDRLIFRNINNFERSICNCREVYTLYPSGNLVQGCPHNAKPYYITECYNCKLASICQPCRLQKYCSFPKKLYSLVNGEK